MDRTTNFNGVSLDSHASLLSDEADERRYIQNHIHGGRIIKFDATRLPNGRNF